MARFVSEGKFQQSFYLPEDLSRNIQYIKRSTRERLRGAQLRTSGDKKQRRTDTSRELSQQLPRRLGSNRSPLVIRRRRVRRRRRRRRAAAREGLAASASAAAGLAREGERTAHSVEQRQPARRLGGRRLGRLEEGSWKAPRRSVRPAGGGAGRPAAARGALQPLGGGLALPLDEVVDAALAIDLGAGQHA